MLLSRIVSVRNRVGQRCELGETRGLEVDHLPPCFDRIRFCQTRVVNEIEIEVIYANLFERIV